MSSKDRRLESNDVDPVTTLVPINVPTSYTRISKFTIFLCSFTVAHQESRFPDANSQCLVSEFLK